MTHWKRPWCWEGLGAGGEGDDRGWGGWMASLIWWTWVWVNSGSWWWTGRPGVLWFTGSQRVRHDWATELNWTECKNVQECSRLLCNIALYSIGPCFYHQSHPQLGIVFALAPSLHSFLELFLHWSPVAYWAPTCLESSSFSVLSFCLFILFMGFSRQEYWSGLPFPYPVDHILSDI